VPIFRALRPINFALRVLKLEFIRTCCYEGKISVAKHSTDMFAIQQEPKSRMCFTVNDLELRIVGYCLESQITLGVTGIE
jgi:hypothetical protein